MVFWTYVTVRPQNIPCLLFRLKSFPCASECICMLLREKYIKERINKREEKKDRHRGRGWITSIPQCRGMGIPQCTGMICTAIFSPSCMVSHVYSTAINCGPLAESCKHPANILYLIHSFHSLWSTGALSVHKQVMQQRICICIKKISLWLEHDLCLQRYRQHDDGPWYY